MSGFDEVLESGRLADIPKTKAAYEQLLKFHWDYYSELEYQRKKVYDSLKASLRDRAKPFEFALWQRAVKYKYALRPLSTTGSVADPGGRFNIGAIDPTRYPVFPALYVASEKGAALAEILGRTTESTSLTAEQIALTRPDSITIVSLSGKLEAVLDVRDENNLAQFVSKIKGFRLSPSLVAKGKKLGFNMSLVKTAQELADKHLRNPAWRQSPMIFDVPANCQIFGRIACDAQIDGILYDSVLTGKTALCIYHQNFRNSTSYVELDDPTPAGVIPRRLDATNCGGA
ncbi:MAG TPA: RES family NAD+ phosphorylase [Candidatus Aquilonibacter sp.]|nr:RES family NAD+ phosphorylase [Candidatus Aquilonibacter sp.]